MFINKFGDTPDIWCLRLYYFFMVGSGAFLSPFLALYYRSNGLTGVQIGVLGSIAAVVAMISAPIWARSGLKVKYPVRLLQLALMGAALAILFISRQHLFVWFGVGVCIQGFTSSGISPLSDSLTIHINRKLIGAGYGSVRLFGSLGWAIIMLFAGKLVEWTSLAGSLYGYAVGIAISIVILNLFVHENPTKETSLDPRNPGKGWGFLKRRRFLLFVVGFVIVLFARNGINSFEGIYLSQLGASAGLIGLAGSLAALIELPGMMTADRLIRRFPPEKVFGVALLLWACAYGVILLFPYIPVIIGVRVITGFAFSFYSVSLVMNIQRQTNATETAAGMALVSVTIPGFVNILASPISGAIFDRFGGYWLYLLGAAGCVIAWLIITLGLKFIPFRQDDDNSRIA
jgi:PPP family 3-phenylpropionic acid transporter